VQFFTPSYRLRQVTGFLLQLTLNSMFRTW